MTRAVRVVIVVVAGLAVVAGAAGFVAWRLSHASSVAPLPAPDAPALSVETPLSAPRPITPPSSQAPAGAREASGVAAPSAPAPRAVESAPSAGRLPFAVGEELRYQVLWSPGGPASLPAGDAVFRVDPGGVRPGASRPGFRLELRVTTAPWISAFFDAKDRFWSVTGPDLAPFTHVQELNEGRRHVTRTMTFDAPRRRVIVASGPPDGVKDAAEFPWVAGVRDPLGAFYQARLIALRSATTLSLPVNNVGHALTLTLSGGELTSVAAEGRTQPALRLDARLDEPGSAEPNPAARVWLSTDARRVPLAIDVTGSFGTFRVELTSYRRDAPGPGA